MSRSKSVWTPTRKTTSWRPPSATSSPVCSSPSTCLTRATSTSRRWCTGSSPTTTPSPSAACLAPAFPGLTCNSDGNVSYRPTWAVEVNYYMDLGFLPPNMQYFSISGRAGWYGPKGDSERTSRAFGPGSVQHRLQDRVQQRADPSDLRRQQGLHGVRSTRTSSTSGSPIATGRTSSASITMPWPASARSRPMARAPTPAPSRPSMPASR